MHVNGTTFGHTLYVIPDLNSEIILMHSVKTVKLSYHEIFCTSLSQIKKKKPTKKLYITWVVYMIAYLAFHFVIIICHS